MLLLLLLGLGGVLFCFWGRRGFLVMVVLGTKPRVLHLLGKYSAAELNSPPTHTQTCVLWKSNETSKLPHGEKRLQ